MGNAAKAADGKKMDAGQIMIKLAAMNEEVMKKVDKSDLEKVKLDCNKYTDKTEGLLKKELDQHINAIKFEHDRLTAEFEQHKSVDFAEIVTKVSLLEKKVQQLVAALASK